MRESELSKERDAQVYRRKVQSTPTLNPGLFGCSTRIQDVGMKTTKKIDADVDNNQASIGFL